MKKQLIAAILCGLLISGLAGCGNQAKPPAESVPDSTVMADDTSGIDTSDVIPAEPTAPEESETPAESSASEPQQLTEKETTKTEPQTPIKQSEPEKQEQTLSDVPSPKEQTDQGLQNSIPKQSSLTETEAIPVFDHTEVQSKAAQYINSYRSSPMAVLPGLTNVAEYRSRQLITNFSHDEDTDVCTLLQYGEYIDMGKYGYPEDSYYRGYSREAIAKGNWTGTADEIARKIAEGFKNSANHWAYLGSAEYRYMAVGCTYDEATQKWYCCVCVSTENYGG